MKSRGLLEGQIFDKTMLLKEISDKLALREEEGAIRTISELLLCRCVVHSFTS
jgi:hypothetical protein